MISEQVSALSVFSPPFLSIDINIIQIWFVILCFLFGACLPVGKVGLSRELAVPPPLGAILELWQPTIMLGSAQYDDEIVSHL